MSSWLVSTVATELSWLSGVLLKEYWEDIVTEGEGSVTIVVSAEFVDMGGPDVDILAAEVEDEAMSLGVLPEAAELREEELELGEVVFFGFFFEGGEEASSMIERWREAAVALTDDEKFPWVIASRKWLTSVIEIEAVSAWLDWAEVDSWGIRCDLVIPFLR